MRKEIIILSEGEVELIGNSIHNNKTIEKVMKNYVQDESEHPKAD